MSQTVTDGVSTRHKPGTQTSARKSPPAGLSLEELVDQLKRENQGLRARLLGVNELARLLQEKTEACENLRDRNKRQEIAIIRLENRCSNYDKKLRQASAAGGGAGSGGGASLKSGQSPFIPGPSRQILEGLMKENSELRKTINNVTKKGQSGYLEAVVCSGVCVVCASNGLSCEALVMLCLLSTLDVLVVYRCTSGV